MKSLAFTKAEQKERNSPKACMPYEGDKYPWGLRLDLNSDVMKKLDVDSLPKTGSEVTIRAKAKVVSTSINDREGKQEKRMELQLVAMEIDTPRAEMEDEIFEGMPDA
jgi:hypothetical protein